MMWKMKCIQIFSLFLFLSNCLIAQTLIPYRVELQRKDGYKIVFNMQRKTIKGKEEWTIFNATEKLKVDDINRKGDSLFVEMPFFDSRMRLELQKDQTISGNWIKGSTKEDIQIPIVATAYQTYRFKPLKGNATRKVNGRFDASFVDADGIIKNAVAEFSQKGNRVTGTFLNPDGDYRFLEGIVTGDSLMLSCFDGSHAYYFGATVKPDGKIINGLFVAGAMFKQNWSAVPNAKVELVEDDVMVFVKPGQNRLNFRFPDLDSVMVSINDERFKNKVVVIQLMGSWCPNCMDETAFLSNYYKQNKSRGVEVIGLSYEYTTDFKRSEKLLRKFQKRYNVDYPILNTGVTSGDSLRTEKTLPQLTPIKAFPTTLYIGKDGTIREIHPGFSGPATGIHYSEFCANFEKTIAKLLNE